MLAHRAIPLMSIDIVGTVARDDSTASEYMVNRFLRSQLGQLESLSHGIEIARDDLVLVSLDLDSSRNQGTMKRFGWDSHGSHGVASAVRSRSPTVQTIDNA